MLKRLSAAPTPLRLDHDAAPPVQEPPDPRVWLPIAEVERRTGLCRKTLWKLADRGKLRGSWVEGSRYLSQASVTRWEQGDADERPLRP